MRLLLRSTLWVLLLVTALPACAQDVARLSRDQQQQLRELNGQLTAAQLREDAVEVRRLARAAQDVLGSQAGLPEVADEYRPAPATSRPLSAAERVQAVAALRAYIERRRWWRIGLDPTTTNHTLREVATVIEGAVASADVAPAHREPLLQFARDAGDFLIWTQTRAETGVFPFPALRNGAGRPFEAAEAMFRRAEQAGRLSELIRHDWVVEDFEDGGLQFDHGLAGVALLHLFEATHDDRYRAAALRGADWAVGRRVVTNWNYNSFSVYLLAEAYRVSGDARYREAAKRKFQLGVVPGQLTDGPRAGRWADPHNARPAYHYIMVRSLAALAQVLPPDDPELPEVVGSLRLALRARNPDFARGVTNADSAVEALLLVQSLPAGRTSQWTDCNTETALATLERYAVERFRNGNPALGPGAWGQLLRRTASH